MFFPTLPNSGVDEALQEREPCPFICPSRTKMEESLSCSFHNGRGKGTRQDSISCPSICPSHAEMKDALSSCFQIDFDGF